MFCQKCHIEYDESRKYCRDCGSLLSAVKDTFSGATGHPSPAERRRTVRACPRCRLHFEVGNYCRLCGSSLKKEDILPGPEPILEKRLVRSLSSEWSRLTRRKKDLETCLGNLEKRRNVLPGDPFQLTFHRYQLQVESLSVRLREIEAKCEAVRTGLSGAMVPVEEESGALRKRLEEIRSLHQAAAMTSNDYATERNDIKRQLRSGTKCLKKCRETISRLSALLEGGSVSQVKTSNLIRQPSPAVLGGILILIAVGVYLLWTRNNTFSHPRGSTLRSNAEPSVQGPLPVSSPNVREDEKIKSLFETIRHANLEKKIDVFMSCYAYDFRGLGEKRTAILENWDQFDYLDLTYDLKRLAVTARTAQVRVEWSSHLSPKHGGAPKTTTSVLDVSLIKEGGHWKIEKTNPVS